MESDIALSLELGYAASVAHFRAELAAVRAFLAYLMPVAVKPAKVRCPHYASIRRFYACAREAHLSAKADDAIRVALGGFLGREVISRESLSGSEWESAATAVKFGELTW